MLEIALVGAGRMGAHHFRVSAALRDARISVIVDSDPQRANRLCSGTDVAVFENLGDVIDRVDAAIVATPTETHALVCRTLIANGVHVLVEKPLAGNTREAKELVAFAAATDSVLMVGHVERFNPVVLELASLVETPLSIEARRVSPYTEHVNDGVVLDLMIHDIDIALSLANSEVKRVDARALRVHGPSEDAAWVILEFHNGLIAQLTASRLGQDKIRQTTITEAARVIRADLIRQDLTIHKVTATSFSGSGYREAGVVEVPYLQHRGEPLFLEQWHFVEAITRRRPATVTGEDALRALEVAAWITKVMDR